VAEKLDVNKIKADLAEQERQRAAEQERLVTNAKKANLDKLAKAELDARSKRITDLEKAKAGLKRQIYDLTAEGKISDENKLRQAIEGYNSSTDLQDKLRKESSDIVAKKYVVSNGKIVFPEATKEGPTGTQPMGAGASVQDTVTLPKTKTKTKTVTGEEVVTPPKKKTKGIPENFDVAGFRMGEEASMETLTPELASATGELPIQEIYELVKSKYSNIDSIFLYNDELSALLREAVGDIDNPADDMDSTEFTRRLGLTDWAKTGAEEWRNRSAEKREYNELLSKFQNQLALATTDADKAKIQEKINTLKTNSTYAKGIASSKSYILKIASGLIGTPSPEVLDALATEIYDSSIEDDPNLIRDKILARFNYTPDAVLGGSAGTNLTALKQVAAANGFDLQEVYGSKINDWVTRMAQGESVETFKSLIRDRAAVGLPDKVGNLLRQGLDLEDVYDPYRQIMASVLEIDKSSIKLTDPTLTNAFGADRELPLYEFKRSLRKDPRWQYTDSAREDVSTAALGILRDFGFQG
jgi:hypothetical protein